MFLLLCFLPQYQLASWIYNHFIGKLFNKYEKKVVNLSQKFVASIKANPNKDSSQSNIEGLTERNQEKKQQYFDNILNEKEEVLNKTAKTQDDDKADEGEKLDNSGIFEDETNLKED